MVTENVRDFRSLVAANPFPGVLFTSSRTFSRSRASTGVLVDALDSWLTAAARSPRPAEDWLQRLSPDWTDGVSTSSCQLTIVACRRGSALDQTISIQTVVELGEHQFASRAADSV